MLISGKKTKILTTYKYKLYGHFHSNESKNNSYRYEHKPYEHFLLVRCLSF